MTLYAIFGGADFGAGVWDLLAGSGDRAKRIRTQIDRSIGPVWEANHVWLIFILVILWTAFSQAFSAIFTTLYIPLALAALGIVLRGSGFAFRHALPGPVERPASRVFGFASVLTPFFMGTVVGAIASGEVPAGGDGDPTSSWTGFLPLVTGVLFVLLTAYTAAVFLVRDSGAAGDTELRDYFERRALAAAVIAGAAAVVGVIALHADGRYVYDGLTSWPGIALVILSGICGLVALGLLVSGRNYGLRAAAVGAGAAVIWGYFAAAFPYILPTSLKISDAAGASTTLTWVIVIFGVAAVTVIPSLVLLYVALPAADARGLFHEQRRDLAAPVVERSIRQLPAHLGRARDVDPAELDVVAELADPRRVDEGTASHPGPHRGCLFDQARLAECQSHAGCDSADQGGDLDLAVVELSPGQLTVRRHRERDPRQLSEVAHGLSPVGLRPGVLGGGDETPDAGDQQPLAIAVAIRDSHADEGVRSEGGPPFELDAVGGVLLHGCELQATAAGLLDHLSALPEPDALGFRGSLRECPIEVPGDGIGQGSLAHCVSFLPLGRG